MLIIPRINESSRPRSFITDLTFAKSLVLAIVHRIKN
jgi:hypothetical protein